MNSLLLALAPCLLPVQSDCDAIASAVLRDQGPPAGPIELAHLGLPLVGGPLPRLIVDGGAPNSPGFVGLGLDALTLPIGPGATLFTVPLLFVPFALDAEGSADLDLAPGFLLPPSTCGSLLVFQLGVLDPLATGGLWYSDGLELRPGEAFDEPLFGGLRIDGLSDPMDVVTADLDQDGVDDLLIAGEGGSRVDVLRGDGAANYAKTDSLLVGIDPFQVAVADFDEDGDPDFVVGHDEPAAPRVLLGGPGLTFSSPILLPAEFGGGVGAGDVTGDGHADVVAVAGGTQDELLVFAGDGAGAFAAPVGVALSEPIPFNNRTFLELADLDGDGDLDVVFRNGSYLGPVSYRNLILMLNDGLGNFTDAPDSPLIAAHEVVDFDLADTNGDGAIDVLGVGAGAPGLTTFVNDGAAGFTQTVTTGLGSSALFPGATGASNVIVAEDLDGNGTVDVAIAFFTTRKIALYSGDGDGTYTFVESYGAWIGDGAAVATDANGDAHPDLLFVNRNGDELMVYPGRAGVAIDAPRAVVIGDAATGIVTADLGGDGVDDLVTLESATNKHSVFSNDGTGALTDVQDTGAGNGADGMTVADVDLDGLDDLLVVSSDGDRVRVRLGQPDGTFGASIPTQLTAGSFPVDLTVGDFDGDGIPDVVTANLEGRSFTLLLGVGDGNFTVASETVIGDMEVVGVDACDVDGDGLTDLALILEPVFAVFPTLRVLRNNGNGTLTEIFAAAEFQAAMDVATGDLNADGFDDVAVADRAGDTWILFGRAPGDAFQLVSYPSAVAEHLAIGDLDGDGLPEVATLSYFSQGLVTVAHATAIGAKTIDVISTIQMGLPGGANDITIADIDGDQRADLVCSAGQGAPVFVLFGRTPSPLDE